MRRRHCCGGRISKRNAQGAISGSRERSVPDAAFLEARLRAIAGAPPSALALAISGGGDSTALLLLAAELRDRRALVGAPLSLIAFTVDHALRPESRDEAEAVARLCAGLKIDHEILTWRRAGPAPSANIQAEARNARYRLMAERRRALAVGPLITAHTLDDVAETFVMRLSRGSGVDGLSQMAERRVEDCGGDPPLEVWRPFLETSSAALRAVCAARGVDWIEDPSNADARFARVQARKALELLAPLGLTTERLARTAQTMARAREALDASAAETLRAAAALEPACGALKLRVEPLRAAPREVGLRALAAAMRWVGGAADYPPRFDSLEAAFDAMLGDAAFSGRTLHGCVLAPAASAEAEGRGVWLGREARAAERLSLPISQAAGRHLWDGRFVLEMRPGAFTGVGDALLIAPLGDAAPPFEAVKTDAPPLIRAGAPGVWIDGALVSAPSCAPDVNVAVRPAAPPVG